MQPVFERVIMVKILHIVHTILQSLDFSLDKCYYVRCWLGDRKGIQTVNTAPVVVKLFLDLVISGLMLVKRSGWIKKTN